MHDKNIKEYSYSDDTGDAQAVVYHLFPGVEVVYISVHMETFDFGLFEQGERNNYASIHFCREGRIEQEVNNEFFYLMPGDCSIALQDKAQKFFIYLLGITMESVSESRGIFIFWTATVI